LETSQKYQLPHFGFIVKNGNPPVRTVFETLKNIAFQGRIPILKNETNEVIVIFGVFPNNFSFKSLK